MQETFYPPVDRVLLIAHPVPRHNVRVLHQLADLVLRDPLGALASQHRVFDHQRRLRVFRGGSPVRLGISPGGQVRFVERVDTAGGGPFCPRVGDRPLPIATAGMVIVIIILIVVVVVVAVPAAALLWTVLLGKTVPLGEDVVGSLVRVQQDLITGNETYDLSCKLPVSEGVCQTVGG